MIKSHDTYVYVTTALHEGSCLSKVGITNNPRKRLNEFNNGVKYRHNHKDYPVFEEFYKTTVDSRFVAIQIERETIKKLSNFKNAFYGREVFNIEPHKIVNKIKGMVAK